MDLEKLTIGGCARVFEDCSLVCDVTERGDVGAASERIFACKDTLQHV